MRPKKIKSQHPKIATSCEGDTCADAIASKKKVTTTLFLKEFQFIWLRYFHANHQSPICHHHLNAFQWSCPASLSCSLRCIHGNNWDSKFKNSQLESYPVELRWGFSSGQGCIRKNCWMTGVDVSKRSNPAQSPHPNQVHYESRRCQCKTVRPTKHSSSIQTQPSNRGFWIIERPRNF